MAKYRKKPVVIEAHQWLMNGDHPKDGVPVSDVPQPRIEGKLVRYYRHPDKDGDILCAHCDKAMHIHGWIDTLEGGHIVCPGDWVITGVKGEHHPCKPDIFEATYEPADRHLGRMGERERLIEIIGEWKRGEGRGISGGIDSLVDFILESDGGRA